MQPDLEFWTTIVGTMATVGAALFAGWAALAAAASARASRDLVAVERERDHRLQEQERNRQALCVYPTLSVQSPSSDQHPRGMGGILTNAGNEPVLDAAIRLKRGSLTWGPRSLAGVPPQNRVITFLPESYFHGAFGSPGETRVEILFQDIRGVHWIRALDSMPRPASQPELDEWRSACREWDSSDFMTDPWARGFFTRNPKPITFGDWRNEVEARFGSLAESTAPRWQL